MAELAFLSNLTPLSINPILGAAQRRLWGAAAGTPLYGHPGAPKFTNTQTFLDNFRREPGVVNNKQIYYLQFP